jgi:pole hole protein
MGSFGKVYKGHWYGRIAVKILKDTYPSETQINAFKNEINMLKKTRHVNILLFMGCVSSEKNLLAIITEWCDGGSLYHHIHVLETHFKMSDIIQMSLQVSQGMTYLHGKNIIHRDLNSKNIFLYDETFLMVKIGDFGISSLRNICSDTKSVTQEGSILWMAPEILTAILLDDFDFKSDIYAFGIVIYELLSNSLPYSDGRSTKCDKKHETTQLSRVQIIWLVGNGSLVPDIEKLQKCTPPLFYSLVLSCIKFKCEERPHFCQVSSILENAMLASPQLYRTVSEPILSVCMSEKIN